MRPAVHLLTNIPSYHQVELFDEIAARGEIDLHVTYLRRNTRGRPWQVGRATGHQAYFLSPRWEAQPWYMNPGLPDHLKRVPGDVLVVTQYAGIGYQQAMWQASVLRRPWVFWSERPGVRFFESSSGVPPALAPLARRLAMLPLRRATEVWAVGRAAKAEYERLLGREVVNFPYYSDLGRFARRGAAYVPAGTVRFLFAGRYSFRKGFDTLCSALRHIGEPGDPRGWDVTTCGSGDLEPELETVQAPAGAVRNIGLVGTENIPEVMRNQDVLLLPSRYDGWGMVVIEALAAGLTVITTREVGAARDVEAGPYLRYVETGSGEELAGAMREVVHSRAELAEAGRDASKAASAFDVAVGASEFSRRIVRLAESKTVEEKGRPGRVE